MSSRSAWSAIGDGFSALVRPPFRTLVLVAVLIALTSTSFGDDPTEIEIASSIVLLIASLYVQIAIILAAGRNDPEPSADAWLRGAVRRRCLWRFVGTSLVVVLGLLAGALLLVVGIFFIGALLAFAQSASVLERKLPMDAVSRSAKLANEARLSVGVVFGLLILVPTLVVQVFAFLEWNDRIGLLWPVGLVIAEFITLAGTIALTRMFVALGGERTPAPDQLAPAKVTRGS
ncbi:MAG: hypothetical protein KY391_04315 [Actinobacteria bacterium]|nr:hypothetical protein [Actinomycetota bacterium]